MSDVFRWVGERDCSRTLVSRLVHFVKVNPPTRAHFHDFHHPNTAQQHNKDQRPEELNMEPENGPSEDYFPLQPCGFQVPCGSLPGCKWACSLPFPIPQLHILKSRSKHTLKTRCCLGGGFRSCSTSCSTVFNLCVGWLTTLTRIFFVREGSKCEADGLDHWVMVLWWRVNPGESPKGKIFPVPTPQSRG